MKAKNGMSSLTICDNCGSGTEHYTEFGFLLEDDEDAIDLCEKCAPRKWNFNEFRLTVIKFLCDTRNLEGNPKP